MKTSEPGDCGALPDAHWRCGTHGSSEDSAAGVHSCESLSFVPAIAKDKGLRDKSPHPRAGPGSRLN